MAVRDAGNYGWDMTFEDAVKKARSENWEDANIVALLAWRKPPPTIEDIKRIPREAEKIKLEDLQFRIDDTAAAGGMIIEYKVEGRPRTQAVPRLVGQVLEALVKEVDALRLMWNTYHILERVEELEAKSERHSGSSGRDGISEIGDRPVKRGRPKGSSKKAKANT